MLSADDTRLTLPLQLTDGEGTPWRYDQRGWVSVSNVSQSIRYGFEPFINGRHSIPWATGSFADAAGREMVSQSASIDNIGVTRRLYIPADAGFIRILDEFKNTTGAPVELSVELQTYQPSSGIHHTSSGDTQIGVDDNYLVVGNPNNPDAPASTIVFSDTDGASLSPVDVFRTGNDYIYQFDLTVPAYDSVSLMSFGAVSQNVQSAIAKGDELELPAPDKLLGVQADDINKIINFKITTGAE